MLKIKVTGPKRVDFPLEFTCPQCGKRHSLKMRYANPGKIIRCSCGTNIRLSGDDCRRFQRDIDTLINSIHKLGR